MKINKFTILILASLAFVSCATTQTNGSTESEEKTKTSASEETDVTVIDSEEAAVPEVSNVASKIVAPDEEHVKNLGRTFYDKDILWMGFSSTGAAFEVNAKRLDVTIAGDSGAVMRTDNGSAARIVAFVNGERKLDEMILKHEQTFTIFDGAEATTGLVQIIKVSEGANSVAGIKALAVDESGEIKPAEEKSLKIEFIGDSITCGYGVDDLDKTHHFKTATEDNSKTYAYKTAQNLDADYSMVSVSGWGVISGYCWDGNKQTGSLIPTIYGKTGYSNNRAGSVTLQNKNWDFSQFVPDFIVINLGTNDASYTKNDSKKVEEFQKGYVKFIKQIRENNPDSKIICTLGIMGQDLYGAIESAVAEYTAETDDSKVYCLKFDQQSMADGIGADWHPSEKTHAKAAAKLTAKIKELM